VRFCSFFSVFFFGFVVLGGVLFWGAFWGNGGLFVSTCLQRVRCREALIRAIKPHDTKNTHTQSPSTPTNKTPTSTSKHQPPPPPPPKKNTQNKPHNSYGLTFRWTPAQPMPAYYQPPHGMQHPPPQQPPPQQQAYYAAQPGTGAPPQVGWCLGGGGWRGWVWGC
jgi:hypothetical protein